MKKRTTLPLCLTAGALFAIGTNLPLGHATTTEAPPAPILPPSCQSQGYATAANGSCVSEENLAAYTALVDAPETVENHEPTPPGMAVPLPYCADGVTVSDGTCEVNWDQITLTDTDPIDVASEDWSTAPVPAPIPAPLPAPVTVEALPVAAAYVETDPLEDEPGWDCRTMGNLVCGVFFVDTWYAVEFSNGLPSAVYVNPLSDQIKSYGG